MSTKELLKLQKVWLQRSLQHDRTAPDQQSLAHAWVTPCGVRVPLPVSDLAQYKYLRRNASSVVWVSHLLKEHTQAFCYTPLLGGFLIYRQPTTGVITKTEDVEPTESSAIDTEIITYAGTSKGTLCVNMNKCPADPLVRNRNYTMPKYTSLAPIIDRSARWSAIMPRPVIDLGRNPKNQPHAV